MFLTLSQSEDSEVQKDHGALQCPLHRHDKNWKNVHIVEPWLVFRLYRLDYKYEDKNPMHNCYAPFKNLDFRVKGM